MLNKSKFINIMTGLCEVYGKTPSEFIYDIYYNIFKDYSLNQVNNAINDCVKEHKYNTLPKPAEILEYIEGSKDDKAMIAWIKVKEALDKADYYQSVEFDDPVISHCIKALDGWMNFCNMTMLKKDMPFVEKRFMDLYRLFLKLEVKGPVKLIGFAETKNRDSGNLENIPEPIAIGYGERKVDLTLNPQRKEPQCP